MSLLISTLNVLMVYCWNDVSVVLVVDTFNFRINKHDFLLYKSSSPHIYCALPFTLSDNNNFYMIQIEPPNFPRNLHVAEQTSRSVLLSWSPGAGSDSPVTSYILQYKEASDMWHEHNAQLTVAGDRSVVLVAGLHPATVYHFRLYAENALGTSAPSDPLHVSK
jgi:hypothetical protein